MQDQLLKANKVADNKYIVLARKYRPRVFQQVISQPHIIKIIENSIKNNRMHHAYILNGIRGVGKTTFARILAKALNCTGNNSNTPVIEPCLKCTNCIAIEEGRHQDIIEIDAASNTGVNDIREIIENAKYKPITARYKVYIIDEVHMLSNSAFNALLKTLEEPPEHVKFILATTELQKIPLTVISRCQRFDLHRFTVPSLVDYLDDIATKEGYKLNKEASKLIAKAAEGSARDGLSLLDQAMLMCEDQNITLEAVTNMLGMVDLEYMYDVFGMVIKGDIKKALKIVRDLYEKGAEPIMILQELIDITYKISLCKIEGEKDLILSDYEMNTCTELAKNLSTIVLFRLWQIFSKALAEMKSTYSTLHTLEMTLIKVVYANLSMMPEDILKTLPTTQSNKGLHKSIEDSISSPNTTSKGTMPDTLNNNSKVKTEKINKYNTIEDLLNVLEEQMEMMLCHTIKHELSIIEFREGYIKIGTSNSLSYNKQKLKEKLSAITGIEWVIETEDSELGINYGQEEDKKIKEKKDKIKNHELVQEVLKSFSGIEIDAIKLANK